MKRFVRSSPIAFLASSLFDVFDRATPQRPFDERD